MKITLNPDEEIVKVVKEAKMNSVPTTTMNSAWWNGTASVCRKKS